MKRVIDYKEFGSKVAYYAASTLFGGAVIGGICFVAAGSSAEYGPYKSEQNYDDYSNLDDNEIYMNSNGEYCKEFEEGEHTITITQRVGTKQTYEQVEGYEIQSIVIEPMKYFSEVTYVNDEDVIAIGELDENNQVEFNEFGKVKKRAR